MRNIKENKHQEKLDQINPSLKFTMEWEHNSSLPFLDMLIKRNAKGDLTSTWYSKKNRHLTPNELPCFGSRSYGVMVWCIEYFELAVSGKTFMKVLKELRYY